MLQITPHMRIVLAVEPVDFRKGIDGLAGICRRVLHVDPFAGTLFVFRNKTGTSLKLLGYDGQGFWLCQKRLSQGRFRWWPDKGDHFILLSMIREDEIYVYKNFRQQLSLKMQVLRDLNKKAETSGQPKSWKEVRKRMEK